MKLWLPRKGEVDTDTWRIEVALKEYDPRLSLARNEETGDWCVYVKMPPGLGAPEFFPVLGLGPETPRDVHTTMERVKRADTARHGERLLREVEESRARYNAESDKKLADLAEVAAEVYDYAHRRSGTHPNAKVFLNGRTRRGYGEYF